jgi:hypothetical protein
MTNLTLIKKNADLEFDQIKKQDGLPIKYFHKMNNELYFNSKIKVFSTIVYTIVIYVIYNPEMLGGYCMKIINQRLIESLFALCRTKLLIMQYLLKKYNEVMLILNDTFNLMDPRLRFNPNLNLQNIFSKDVIRHSLTSYKIKGTAEVNKIFCLYASFLNFNNVKYNLRDFSKLRKKLFYDDINYQPEKYYLTKNKNKFIFNSGMVDFYKNMKNKKKKIYILGEDKNKFLKLKREIKSSKDENNQKFENNKIKEKSNLNFEITELFNKENSILNSPIKNTQNLNNTIFIPAYPRKNTDLLVLDSKKNSIFSELSNIDFSKNSKSENRVFKNTTPSVQQNMIKTNYSTNPDPAQNLLDLTINFSLNSPEKSEKEKISTPTSNFIFENKKTEKINLDFDPSFINHLNNNITNLNTSLRKSKNSTSSSNFFSPQINSSYNQTINYPCNATSNLTQRRNTNIDLPSEESVILRESISVDLTRKSSAKNTLQFNTIDTFDFSNLYRPVIDSLAEDKFDPVTINNNLRGFIIVKIF